MTRKEAINIVKNNWPDSSYTRLQEALEILIPELKESEDEKIKKDIISFVEQAIDAGYGIIDKERKEKWLAWLEKQGKQKPIGLESAAKMFLEELSITPYNNKPITDAQVITKELLNFLQNSASYNPDALNMQQPIEWSEDDKHRLKDTIYFLETAKKHYASTTELDACIIWLKSLKLQPHWKPSDEQMKALKYALGEGGHYSKSALESLYSDLQKL